MTTVVLIEKNIIDAAKFANNSIFGKIRSNFVRRIRGENPLNTNRALETIRNNPQVQEFGDINNLLLRYSNNTEGLKTLIENNPKQIEKLRIIAKAILIDDDASMLLKDIAEDFCDQYRSLKRECQKMNTRNAKF